MIVKRRTSGHVVLPVFYDVDPSKVRKQIGSFEGAFTRHEEKLKSETGGLAKEKLKDKLGTWRAALREVADLAGMNLQNQTRAKHQENYKSGWRQAKLHIIEHHPQLGRNAFPSKKIQIWLEDGLSNVGIVAVCGMGGIGKTTTATFLYNLNFPRFEGAAMIKDALCRKKVFVVLDDVDKLDQLDALLGVRGWLFSGSKIIITTRHERLLGAYEFYKVHRLENLSEEESLELFSWHAFGKCCPNNGYGEVSKRAVSYCGGLPLAIKVLGLSLDKDSTVTILDRCEFYTVVRIQNLVDRCLISIGRGNTLVMHHLLQEMGREIVHQVSPKEPGKRSILWNSNDALRVLREDTIRIILCSLCIFGTSEIEGLKFDICLLKQDAYASTDFGDNRRSRLEEFLKKRLLSNLGVSYKRYGFSIFSSHLNPTDPENSNQVALEADAFARMRKLKLLQLNHIDISGPYKKFPKELRWLCWHGFPLKSIPCDFPLESLVALDMQYGRLKNVWEGTKIWETAKVKRNLRSSICMLKHLEMLVISGCSNLDGLPTN
ncbi:disease resistance protein RPV1-like [Rhododendron vialii]|uniref:disease resistance protein RPV1-like n=1 Tax=Rhododendron vialii TaxID=182163 RepID=UPI00265DFF6A|nr:disease resistance protein RPV1-like [Rhododendron vialii]